MLVLTDGTKYMGQWENGLCHGLGIMVKTDKQLIKTMFLITQIEIQGFY